ncbi:MAG: phage portal protein [Clostridia bacterium]|nr:phage portal protein [Clostridia bacterium]
MLTYQDFAAAADRGAFLARAVREHRASEDYAIARDASLYDRQMNVTIREVVRTIYTRTLKAAADPVASNNRIACNFFNRLLTQRVNYLLGNGVTFTRHHRKTAGPDGTAADVDETREMLGRDFDTQLKRIAYAAEMHGVSFGFVNYDSGSGWNLHLFPLTEFVPLYDEETGSLRAGIRFWCPDWGNKPTRAVLYEENGYTRLQGGSRFEIIEPRRAYRQILRRTGPDRETVIGGENYAAGLPVIPFYGKHRQSALVGMRAAIDSYDLIQSGFANDLADCAQIYWLISGALGMDDEDLTRFRERLLFQHIALADLDGSSVTPYTQDVPFQARQAYLAHIRSSIYEDFGALDVTNMAASSRTATEIEAAYQPLDEEADDFEYRCIAFIRQALRVMGVDDMPVFKRNRISNQLEQTQMVMLEAAYLDRETVLSKLPNVTPDEAQGILARAGGGNGGDPENAH